MKLSKKSEWFIFDSPIGETNTNIRWKQGDEYHIEHVVKEDGETIWFGINVNWKKEKGGEWTVLSINENAKPLEKYLPDIVYGEDRRYWKPCEPPIYEQLYQKYYYKENKLNRIVNETQI